jgi:c-di-GMP-binding flagellar brake protein YcgR
MDISGGGIQIKTKLKLKEGDQIKISFKKLIKLDKLIKGKIVRKRKENFEVYKYGIEFIDISDRNREMIIQWIFNLQRKLRQKGLGR